MSRSKQRYTVHAGTQKSPAQEKLESTCILLVVTTLHR